MTGIVRTLRKCGDHGVGDGGEIAQAKPRRGITAHNTPLILSLILRDFVSFYVMISLLERRFQIGTIRSRRIIFVQTSLEMIFFVKWQRALMTFSCRMIRTFPLPCKKHVLQTPFLREVSGET